MQFPENLVPGPVKQAKAHLRPGRLVRARRINYSRFHDGHDFAGRPQVDTIRVALNHRWRVDRRMVVSVVCAAFQAIAEHATSDRADDEG